MRLMPKANTISLKSRKAGLLGTSALVCLALATPVMATDFVITSSDGSTNCVGTTDGVAGAIAANAINGSDTVSLGIALVTPGIQGIKTSGGTNTVTVSEADSIKTTGNNADGIYNAGDTNTTTVSGSITTTGNTARGIHNKGDNNETTISATGSIKTVDYDAYGILNEGHDNITTIAGGISTKSSYGLANQGNRNISYLEASIQTSGTFTDVIRINGVCNKTYISGQINIDSAGQDSVGIAQWGSNNQTFISVTVKASGQVLSFTSNPVSEKNALLNFKGSGNEFVPNEGAIIIGQVGAHNPRGNGASNNKFTINLGTPSSYAYSISSSGEGTGVGQLTFSDLDGRNPTIEQTS